MVRTMKAKLALLGLVLVLCSAGAFATISTTSLSSYWSFDTDLTDDHASNDGTGMLGGARTTTGCFLGGGCSVFDGDNDYIEIGDDTSLDFGTGDFSISFWINPDTLNTRQFLMAKGDWSDGAPNRWHIELTATNKIKFQLYENGGVVIASETTDTLSSTGTWYHIVAVADGGTTYIYLDDNTPITDTDTRMNLNNAHNLHIGESGDAGGVTFDGKIDEIAIWKGRAITGAEVGDLYASGSGFAYPFTAGGDDPVLSGVPDQSTNEDTSPVFSVDLRTYASDTESADNDLVFTIDSETNSALIDCSIASSYYLECGNPTSDQNGYNDVTIQVTDEDTQTDTDIVRVSVTAVNDDPVLASVPDVSTNENTAPSNTDLFPYASDGWGEDSDTELTFSITSQSNTDLINCSITSDQYLTCGTPLFNGAGTSIIVVRATDTGALYNEDTINVVVNTNPPPEITITAPSDSALYASFEDIIINISANDSAQHELQYANIYVIDSNGTTQHNATIDINSTSYNYNATLNASTWADGSFTTTAVFCDGLDYSTLYECSNSSTTAVLGEAGARFYAKDISTLTTINTFNLTINGSLANNESNTTTGTIFMDVPNGLYNVTISAVNYTPTTTEIFISNAQQSFTLYIAKPDSVSILVYDMDGNAINNASIELIGDTHYYDVSTGADNLFYNESIEYDNYTIQISKADTINGTNYTSAEYYIEHTNGSYVILSAYLDNSSLTGSREFTIENELGQLVDNSTISFLREIDNVIKVVAQGKTDYSGIVNFYLNPAITYIVRVEHPTYLTRELSLKPTRLSYIITISGAVLNDYETLFNDTSYTYSPESNALYANTTAELILSVSNNAGALEWFKIEAWYNGTNYSVIENSQPSGSIITLDINLSEIINETEELNVSFLIKRSGFEAFNLTKTYYVYPAINNSNNFKAWGIEFKEETNPLILYLIAGIISLILVAVVAFFTSNLWALSGVALTSLGVFVYIDWISGILVTMITIPVIIIIIVRGR